ncbi:MAG: transglutaminase domain-containing protein [Patescibacteria group bacterium]|nr:transglutaminase domain-containing protein [Patescibacteria group bacterium]
MKNSQIETTPEIKDLVANIKTPITPETLVQIRNLMYSKLKMCPYDDSTKEHEKAIRWKRTADEILKDGYVYQEKACTDLTVLFIALCKALDLETSFVKVKKGKMVHSVAEVRLNDGWYVFDVAGTRNTPIKGVITKLSPYKDWQIMAKGQRCVGFGPD